MKYSEFIKHTHEDHKKPRHIESAIQQRMVEWFRLQYPQYVIAAVPNGGYRNAVEATIMKREGVLAGFSDLVIIANHNVLFVEVKTATGKQSPAQKVFEERVTALGFRYVICRAVKDFAAVVSQWLRCANGKRDD